MISGPIKRFAIIGLALSVLIALIPIGIKVGRPYFFQKKFAQIRSEQLALQALRKTSPSPTQAAEPTIAAELKLEVPFTPQAPTANWDELHNQACEEASAIMANAYFTGTKELTPALVEKEIAKLTEWQKQNYGYNLSIDTFETVKMIGAVYKLQAATQNISEGGIKKALNENKLVLIPANGRLLGNPNFKTPGPIYHMLVVTGYDSKGFITNDPGTRKGLDYRYGYQTLYDAAGNWSHAKEEVDLSDKQIIIVSK